MNVSMTITGLVISVIMTIVRGFNLDLDEGQVTEVVSAIGVVIGFLTVYVGRVRQGDISWYGTKLR